MGCTRATSKIVYFFEEKTYDTEYFKNYHSNHLKIGMGHRKTSKNQNTNTNFTQQLKKNLILNTVPPHNNLDLL